MKRSESVPLDIKSAMVPRDVKRVEVFLEAYDSTVWVEYVPGLYDWEIERRMVLEGDKMPAGVMRDFILKFVVDWDLSNGGVKIPVTPEGLSMLDFTTIQAPIATGVLSDMSEGKGQRTVSSSPSRSRVQQKKSRGQAPLQALPQA